MWSLLAVAGVNVGAVFIVARTLGIRIALEAAAGLVALYCVVAVLLTAMHVAALRDVAASEDDRFE